MNRALSLLWMGIVLAACATPTGPTPTGPTPTGRPATDCLGRPLPTPTPANLGSPGCTQTPPPLSPTATTSPIGTPTATPSSSPTSSATPTAGLNFKVFAANLDSLTFLANAGDSSNLLYAVEQAGRIRLVHPDGTVDAQPFLDLADRVSSGGERGLLGLAFHPGYADNGRFYVDYTDLNGNTVVSEFLRQTPTSADPASERVIFTVNQPFANHNGGMLAFGPDGKLYVGLGDGGSGGDPMGNGQNARTLLGKIVRVDVDAAGPAAKPSIWDLGLRNPWRFSFDSQTGDLWIGDVGQGQWEEIDAEPAATGGRNYGWNIMEGAACYNATSCNQTGLTLPVATYGHDGGNCAVIGGYVYRGTASPGLMGTYLYADLCSANVWGLDAAAVMAGAAASPVLLGNVGAEVSSFGQDQAGELYVVEHAGRTLSLTYSAATPPR